MRLVYIGHDFYLYSGSVMSSLYTEDGSRSDWGKVNAALRNGEEIHIRQATDEELKLANEQLERINKWMKGE